MRVPPVVYRPVEAYRLAEREKVCGNVQRDLHGWHLPDEPLGVPERRER
ncbi:MAG: hypothetical protein ACM3S0_09120 [Acidobacteriota bacterium]